MHKTLLILAAATLIAACAPPQPGMSGAPVVRYSADARFDTVRDDLHDAIIARGLVIDNTSYVAKMLDRTGKDVGSTKAIYADGQGQAFSFCSAVLSRKTMEADPHNMVFCPYTLVVYRTAAEPGKVHVAYRRPMLPDGSEAARASLKDVETLLDGIAREALSLGAPAG
jgi:uncharacterized protein (DUF302 family)